MRKTRCNTNGSMVYVPQIVITELGKLMQEDKIPKRAKAFEQLVKYAKVGKEMDRIRKFKFDRGMF